MSAEADALSALDAFAFEGLSSSVEPLPAPPALRERILETLSGAAKFLPFCGELAQHFDLSVEQMKELLSQIDEPGRWMAGIEPIQGFLHFQPGPRHEQLHGGFVRMRRGTAFPMHRHRHRELSYVLEGSLVDDRGDRRGPGGIFEMPEGSAHTLSVAGESDCLIALLHGSIEMIGT